MGVHDRLQPSIFGEMRVIREVTSLVQRRGRGEEGVPGILSVIDILVLVFTECSARSEDGRSDEGRARGVVEVAVGTCWSIGVVGEDVSGVLKGAPTRVNYG